jgi:ankyrin repeat protein
MKVAFLGSEASPSYVSRKNGKMLGIHICSYFGLNQVIESLIADSVDIYSMEPYGRTPLFLTIARGHEAVVKLLLATNWMVVNLKDNKDLAPLSVAARDGNEAARSCC